MATRITVNPDKVFTGSNRGQGKHGTQSGYSLHRQAGQPACDECKAAHNAYEKARRIIRHRKEVKADAGGRAQHETGDSGTP